VGNPSPIQSTGRNDFATVRARPGARPIAQEVPISITLGIDRYANRFVVMPVILSSCECWFVMVQPLSGVLSRSCW